MLIIVPEIAISQFSSIIAVIVFDCFEYQYSIV